jgi:pentose-5-phosphate-3-epimerase
MVSLADLLSFGFCHHSSSLKKLVEVRECVEENFVFLRSWVSIAVDGKVNHRVVDNVAARAGVVVMERMSH